MMAAFCGRAFVIMQNIPAVKLRAQLIRLKQERRVTRSHVWRFIYQVNGCDENCPPTQTPARIRGKAFALKVIKVL